MIAITTQAAARFSTRSLSPTNLQHGLNRKAQSLLHNDSAY